MRVLLASMAVGVVLAAGCASRKANPPVPQPAAAGGNSGVFATPPAPRLIVTPGKTFAGKVAKVNVSSRFVVVNFAGGLLPALGQVLPVYRGGLKVGEIRMSGPQLEDNLVGDVVAGEAQAGDDVREN